MPYIGAGVSRFTTADGLTVSGNASVSGTTALTGNATAAGNLDVTGNVDVDGTTTVDGLTSSAALDVTTSTHANASVFKSTGNTQLFLQDTDASSDDQFWGLQVSGGDFNILTCDDDRASGFITPLTIDSNGTATFTEGDAITVIDRVGTNVAGIKTGAGDDFCVGTADFNQAIRIKNSTGHVGVGTTAPSGHFHVSSADSEIVNFIDATKSDYTGEILYVQTTRTANTTHRYFKANENNGAATSIQILGNGNVQNANNSYGSTSDQRIKQDVTDANSQWDDIKALSFKNYKEKYRVSVDGDDAPVLLGLIAQDLEAAGMNGLVEHLEPDTYQKDTLGIADDVKAIKYSVLYMKAVKALQEAMTRIETLETEMTALKARVTALEDA